MKRSRIFAAMMIVTMLSSLFSPLVFSVSASQPYGPTGSGLVFEGPDVIRVVVDDNHPAGWPGATTQPRPFSTEERFWAPFGTPGVTFDLSSASSPHAPTNANGFGEGWVRRGTALGSIEYGAWGRAWGPWYVGGVASPPFVHIPAADRDHFPDDPPESGIFMFEGWYDTPARTGGTRVRGTSHLYEDTTLYGRWGAHREVRIRHEFSDGVTPGANFNRIELPNGYERVRIGDSFNLGARATDLHHRFVGMNFYLFMGWSVATGSQRTPRQFDYIDNFDPGMFNQTIVIAYPRDPQGFASFADSRLYLIANWRVVPPGTTVWVPPDRPDTSGPSGGGGSGGGGGAGAGQQTNPPGVGGGVIGGGVGAGQGPGMGEPVPDDGIPYYTATPETGGAPLIPIVTTFPAVVPPSAVAPLPVPFTPTPLPEAPVVLEIPALRIPVVGFDSGTWALMNLLLAIAGALGAAATVLYVWRKNRQRDEEARVSRDEREEAQKRRKQWLMAVGLVSLVSLVLFPLTQDMSNRMTLLDVWTIAHVILFVVQGIAAWQIVRRKESRDGDSGGGGGFDMAQAGA